MEPMQQYILYVWLLQLFTIDHLVATPTANITQQRSWYLLENEKCGNSNADRIIGGRNADIGWYPWIARIGYTRRDYSKGSELEYGCAGSLINELYIVTAAHCVWDLPSGFKVAGIRLGEFNTTTNPDCKDSYCAEPVQDFEPASIMFHQQYDDPPFSNDIAIIRLNRPARLNEFVIPICLPKGDLLEKNFTGKTAEAAGWGIYNLADPKLSTILQTIKLPMVDTAKCEKVYHGMVYTDQQLCAGGIVGEDSCSGDSGGPLMKVEVMDGHPQYFLIGIVSFGVKDCGSAAIPAVYTKVSHYITWILDNIEP